MEGFVFFSDARIFLAASNLRQMISEYAFWQCVLKSDEALEERDRVRNTNSKRPFMIKKKREGLIINTSQSFILGYLSDIY